jgi:hypothetical protein
VQCTSTPAPITDTRDTQKTKQAAAAAAKEEVVTRLSFKELATNYKHYVGKRVAVNDELMVLSIQSYYELARGYQCPDADEPCILNGGPRNPRCEYQVYFSSMTQLSYSALSACVPRSKLRAAKGLWAMERGIRVVGIVDPNSYAEHVALRDTLIIQPKGDTSEE